jgi:ketosteroid isomerase-like protein
MAGEQNVETAKRAYEAFSAGDGAAAMADMTDDIEWVTPGDSAVGGTRHGKQEVGELWSMFASQGFTTSPQHWFSDDERVVVLTRTSLAGRENDQVDVLTFRDGKLVKFQSAGDTAQLERVFGPR